MDSSQEEYKITCKRYPCEFIKEKNLAKEYFRQFGKLKRLILKPKLRICTVEYADKESYLNALNNAGEYNGTIFKVISEKSTKPKKKKLKSTEPIWIDDNEVNAELAAMGGLASSSYSFGTEAESLKVEKVPKLKRSWASEAKKKPKIKEKTSLDEHVEKLQYLELCNVIKSQAVTLEEKYKVLDARDKLIRIKLKKILKLKSSPTVGTCPDMCPEKERLMRETKHQVALYEQEDSGKAMNQSKAIKQYSRSSADQESPLPHELRPVSVLQMTMSYLMHNIINLGETNDVNFAEWYHFLWDRTRGIRKDITQQALCNQGAVELIEQCARFHIHCSARLVGEDPSVFDQKINTENLTKCLQSLKYMYHDLLLKGERCPNEAEFRAYIILLNLNDGNFMWEVQELTQEIQKSKEVKFALEVYSAIDKNNYVKFFNLVYSTTYLNACILMRYFIQVRVTAIKTLLKCYTSRAFRSMFPLSELKQLLAFDDIESTIEFTRAYGLSISEDKMHIVLDKNTFLLPELPYVLDRSLNVVESKRICSVGEIICGKELPPITYQNHIPQNSFDPRGYLIFLNSFGELDLEMSNLQSEDDMMEPFSSSENVSVTTTENIILQQSAKEKSQDESFAKQKKDEALRVFEPASFGHFSQPKEPEKSIFTKDDGASTFQTIISSKQYEREPVPRDVTDSSHFSSSKSIFARNLQGSSPAFPKFSNIIFGGLPATNFSKTAPKIQQPKKGGFYFDLPVSTHHSNISHAFSVPLFPPALQSFRHKFSVQKTDTVAPQVTLSEKLRISQRKIEEKQPKQIRKDVEELRKREELEKKQLEEKLREESKLREKKQRQEKELERRIEELKQEEHQKEMKIRNTIRSLLDKMVAEVDDKIRHERLEEIKSKIQKRVMLQVIHKWRQVLQKHKKKRKAMDCSPVWVNTQTLEQSAKELYTTSQQLTLMLRKRYKYGKALDIKPAIDDKVSKINLFPLTFAALNQRFFSLRGTLLKNIFWKVEISLPDHYELRTGLTRIEGALKDAFQWEDRNGTVMLMEQVKPNPLQSVTYCIERQRGLFVRYGDANGIIFIAKDYNKLLQRRIIENLKNLGVFTKVPIVIILQEYNEGDCNLHDLIKENIVSDYIILIQNITPHSLIDLVKEGLIFLASNVEKLPPLELDTLSSFLEKYLCTEIWKRTNSFAKWNSHYKTCLRNPNIVISLYNEALSKLKNIVLDKSTFEYPNFPEVFKDYLQSEIPDYLPCNYCYFPAFWKCEMYISKLEQILKSFTLPKWSEKWPPSSELELEVNLSKYCMNIFSEPEKPFYRVMSILLKDVDANENFEDVCKVLWSDVIEILALEKLKETELGLSGTTFETKSVFNQFVVVYNVNMLEDYTRNEWFYVNHPMIKEIVESEMRHEEISEQNQSNTILEPNVNVDLDKNITEVYSHLKKRDYSQWEKELEDFQVMLSDLEDGIRIHKKISSKIEENLKKALSEN